MNGLIPWHRYDVLHDISQDGESKIRISRTGIRWKDQGELKTGKIVRAPLTASEILPGLFSEESPLRIRCKAAGRAVLWAGLTKHHVGVDLWHGSLYIPAMCVAS